MIPIMRHYHVHMLRDYIMSHDIIIILKAYHTSEMSFTRDELSVRSP